MAIGHFNISELAALKAIVATAKELNVPVMIGVSEGERDFIGVRQAASLIKSIREEFDLPIFLNADHTHSVERIEEAARAGFDEVLFDGSKLSFEENIEQTKKAVEAAKSINPDILVEGEIGYIGSSSQILKELPAGAAIKEGDLTKPEDAAQFVKETGIDLLAPAVGNIHGMFAAAKNPRLNIERISAIRKSAGVPLVLHGGSGIVDEDFISAIKAGISIIHINTEIRLAWRQGLDKALKENSDEVTPYKILPAAVDAVAEVVKNRLKLFNEK